MWEVSEIVEMKQGFLYQQSFCGYNYKSFYIFSVLCLPFCPPRPTDGRHEPELGNNSVLPLFSQLFSQSYICYNYKIYNCNTKRVEHQHTWWYASVAVLWISQRQYSMDFHQTLLHYIMPALCLLCWNIWHANYASIIVTYSSQVGACQ